MCVFYLRKFHCLCFVPHEVSLYVCFFASGTSTVCLFVHQEVPLYMCLPQEVPLRVFCASRSSTAYVFSLPQEVPLYVFCASGSFTVCFVFQEVPLYVFFSSESYSVFVIFALGSSTAFVLSIGKFHCVFCASGSFTLCVLCSRKFHRMFCASGNSTVCVLCLGKLYCVSAQEILYVCKVCVVPVTKLNVHMCTVRILRIRKFSVSVCMCFMPQEVQSLCVQCVSWDIESCVVLPVAHYMCFVWQEVCDQAAMSGVWHSGLHDTGQDCKAATSAGLDHSPGTCKQGMPFMQEFTQGITCYAGHLILSIVFSSDHLCSISAVSTVDSEMKVSADTQNYPC